jgi:hypothetical protein
MPVCWGTGWMGSPLCYGERRTRQRRCFVFVSPPSLYVNIFPDPRKKGQQDCSLLDQDTLPGKGFSLHTARPIGKDRASLAASPSPIDDWRDVAVYAPVI